MRTLTIERQFINEELARQAKESFSWGDYDPNSSMGATVTYERNVAYFENAVNELLSKTYVDDETFEKVQYYGNRYGTRLANAINDENANTARCPSIMIAGGSNFPVRKKEKQMERAEKLWERDGSLYKIDENNYYYSKIESLLSNRTIYSDDKNAVVKLSKRLSELEEEHKNMVEENKIARKEKREAPFPAYKLTNSNATINRLRKRIESLNKISEKPISAENQSDKFTIVRDTEEMRLKLIFPSIPTEETRAILKKNGFRWSPKNKAWQRLLNDNSEAVLDKIKGMIQ